jgi:hypothetical protein
MDTFVEAMDRVNVLAAKGSWSSFADIQVQQPAIAELTEL